MSQVVTNLRHVPFLCFFSRRTAPFRDSTPVEELIALPRVLHMTLDSLAFQFTVCNEPVRPVDEGGFDDVGVSHRYRIRYRRFYGICGNLDTVVRSSLYDHGYRTRHEKDEGLR